MKIKCYNSYLLILFLSIYPVLISGQNNSNPGFRTANNKIYVIAHRGAHNGIPENSLAAYQKAIDLGCDFVEIDVRTTSDGQFVSVHNATIDSYVLGKTGKVNEMTLAELKALDIGTKTGKQWENTRIPTFEEILQICQGKIGIYIDLKDAPISALMQLIRKYNMERDIVWYIPWQYLAEIENTGELFGNSFPMPDPHTVENIEPALSKIKTPVIATDMGTLSANFVVKANQFGAIVFADEKSGNETEWETMIDWGTAGIQTDNPEALITFLRKRQ